jgi:hypothetical protein
VRELSVAGPDKVLTGRIVKVKFSNKLMAIAKAMEQFALAGGPAGEALPPSAEEVARQTKIKAHLEALLKEKERWLGSTAAPSTSPTKPSPSPRPTAAPTTPPADRRQGKVSERLGLTAANTLEELRRIIHFDAAAIYDEDGSIRSMHDLPPEVRSCIASVETKEIYGDDGKVVAASPS